MSDATEHDDLIQKWLQVNSSTDEQQARFYLEANNWDLNAALSNFYEAPPMSEGLSPPRHDPSLPLDPSLAAAPAAHPPAAAPVISAGPIHAAAAAPQPAATPSASVPRRRYGSGARIATLFSHGSQANGSDSEEEEQEDRPEEWYAGGERSGMAIQPPSQGQNPDEGRSLVDRILRRASEGGPALGSGAGTSSNTEHTRRFVGRGRTIGSNAPGESEHDSQSDASDSGDDEDEVAVRKLTFWRNGFSIDDGPLYNMEDPVNRQYLDAISQGRAPLDILNVRPGQRVEMRIVERRGENYIPPAAPPAQPFSGQGRRLGSIAPAVEGSSSAPSASSQPAQPPASNPIVLDPGQPTVQVQIRLADGTRLVAKANPSHTIGDLRSYVLSQRPEAALRPFAFKIMMPPKVLDNYSVTIKDAGIANSAIAQYFV
ncbi:protein phosphatase regulator [Coemansia sp. RSA 2336]|nr:protein phosphatase regulator [Coemansia sp. RSA 2336]